MPDKKLTDNEKTKALECCIEGDCDNCPYDEQTACNEYMKQDCLDLINRLQARVDDLERNDLPRCKDALRRANEMGMELQSENERLKEEKSKLENKIDEIYPLVMQLPNAMQQAKAEAYKEFAERLKEKLFEPVETWLTSDVVREGDIDNLLKELVGEEK